MASNGNGNNHKQVAALDRRLRAVKLFAGGMTAAEIAAELKVCLPSVYNYIKDARINLLRTKQDYFAEQTAILVDDLMQAAQTHSRLFADEDFLRTADPEKLKALATSVGVLTDKLFLLANAASRKAPDGQQPALPPGSAESASFDGEFDGSEDQSGL